MSRATKTVPVSDLRRSATALLKTVKSSREPLVVTQRGRAAAVLLSVEEFERRERDVAILRLLAEGEREIAAGEGYDLDDVLAEADELLRPGER
jgi:prevent-host-death family protein